MRDVTSAPTWLVAVAAALVTAARGQGSDSFSERLELRPLPAAPAGLPQLAAARFRFEVQSPLSAAFRANHFDLFPKPVGKLLNSQPGLRSFEASLTRGRWQEEWGPPPRDLRPNGAVLIASTATRERSEVDAIWRFLVSGLAGSLCASFEGMERDREPAWTRPLDLPWGGNHSKLRVASLPYEPVCTENLTPWLRLLPCGNRRGLSALLGALALAESPSSSLSLKVTLKDGHVELQATLDAVLPLNLGAKGPLSAWLGSSTFQQCPAASSSSVHVWPAAALASDEAARVLDSSAFVQLPQSSMKELIQMESRAQAPWDAVMHTGGDAHAVDNSFKRPAEPSVTRDVLSREGYSERTHGRYLLRFASGGKARVLRFMDQLPYFIQPLWHTFEVTVRHGDSANTVEELRGWDALRRLSAKVEATDGVRTPTTLSLDASIPEGGTVSVVFDVLKNFLPMTEFSYACEKGFDVGSAVWTELRPEDADAEARSMDGSRLRLTQGYIILMPMPDFSMPFNVIALTSTAVTFFFGSVFRLTAAGHQPHWVLKSDIVQVSKVKKVAKALVMALALGCLGLPYIELQKFEELRSQLPSDFGIVVDYLLKARESAEKLNR